jgi:hypothetical protein
MPLEEGEPWLIYAISVAGRGHILSRGISSSRRILFRRGLDQAKHLPTYRISDFVDVTKI